MSQQATAKRTKRLYCPCGGEFRVTRLPRNGLDLPHQCESCNYLAYVRGQAYPETTTWAVEIYGLTDEIPEDKTEPDITTP